MIRLSDVDAQNYSEIKALSTDKRQNGSSADIPVQDMLISDFSATGFQAAFQEYLIEMGASVTNLDGLIQEMNAEPDNRAFIRTLENGNVIGLIQFQPIKFTSSFFDETRGFIREFWVAPNERNRGHGTALLRLAEQYFCKNGIFTSILTTDTAGRFYEKHGYKKALGCKAQNQDTVYIKMLE